MNSQKTEKRDSRVNGDLVVHSIFDTIQGEGPFAGVPATFVRLAGCNLQCPTCDTDYTSTRKLYTPWEIKDRVASAPKHSRHGRLVVFTGGEPFRQNIGPVVRKLEHAGFRVQIETNGTLYVPGPWNLDGVTIICSPKTPTLNEKITSYIKAYKYVVDYRSISDLDGLPTLTMNPSHEMPARPPIGFKGPVYLQPLDEKDEETNLKNRAAAVESCLRFGHTLSLQLHKILGME